MRMKNISVSHMQANAPRAGFFSRVWDALAEKRKPDLMPLALTEVESQEPLIRLHEKVKKIDAKLSVIDLFCYMRQLYLGKAVDEGMKKYLENARVELPEISVEGRVGRELRKLIKKEKLGWGNLAFHIKYRIHTFAALGAVLGEGSVGLAESLRERYIMSVLPSNLVLPEVRGKFIPSLDYFGQHLTGTLDPYGIWMKGSIIRDDEGCFVGMNGYLSSRKFEDVILANMTEVCPIGCTSCYKGPLTREAHGEVRVGVKLFADERRAVSQMKGIVEWLNKHQEVEGIVLSGGEPLIYSNKTYAKMLEVLKGAKHLKVVRICTGTIFQGLPSRIDEGLLGLLEGFSRETGKRVAFNAHISSHHQFTPEALLAVRRIKRRGFDILLQMPIQSGINFFMRSRDDEEGRRKTLEYFRKISAMANAVGVQNYKWIVDMHPRTQRHIVPIEPLIGLISEAFENHRLSDMTRPNYVELLCRQGNVYLNRDTPAALAKLIDKELGLVAYFIAVGDAVVLHREPLLEGLNDNELPPAHELHREKLERAKERYITHLLPFEREMKQLAEAEDISQKTKEALFEAKRKHFEDEFDRHFPPIVQVGV